MQFVKLRLGSDHHLEQDDIESETGAPQSKLFTGLEPNVQIGDFVVERRLGSGGMGIVYQAFQRSLNRPVALKVLPASVNSDKTAIMRFRREARAAAKLHHTNIIAIYAEGEENGICYYAMEMLTGRSLDKVIKELRSLREAGVGRAALARDALRILSDGSKRFNTRKDGSHAEESSTGRSYYDCVARLMAEAAMALDYAHRRDVIHRDVKPSNLMLTDEGHLVLMDFGLARLLDEQRMTLTGSFVGTPHYMSPELIAGHQDQIDHRIDVYSLGATLYELLALIPPFEGIRQEQITHKILHRDPVKLRQLDDNIPLDLETICYKAMEKSPSRRYASAAEMADDLHRYLNRYVIKAKKAGLCTWVTKFVSRHRLPTALAGVILIVALVAGSMTWKYRRLDRVQKHVIPEIVDLVERDEFFDALMLARKVERITSGDPTLQDLWSRLSRQFTIRTNPAGAKILIGKREERDNWKTLGRSPLNRIRIPYGTHRLRIDRPGYRTLEFAFSNPFPRTYQPLQSIEPKEIYYELQPEASLPPEMVWISSSDMSIYPLYKLNLNVPDVPAYLID
ncbi:MAG: serine/threonine-protein kinase, partial [Planctomycetota bacterium]